MWKMHCFPIRNSRVIPRCVHIYFSLFHDNYCLSLSLISFLVCLSFYINIYYYITSCNLLSFSQAFKDKWYVYNRDFNCFLASIIWAKYYLFFPRNQYVLFCSLKKNNFTIKTLVLMILGFRSLIHPFYSSYCTQNYYLKVFRIH